MIADVFYQLYVKVNFLSNGKVALVLEQSSMLITDSDDGQWVNI